MKKTNILTLSHDYQMDKSQVLGKGSTGQVYLGKQISTGIPVAIKLIKLETIDNQVTQYLLRMQKAALTALNHENILKGLKIIENSSKCYIITEYCNGGTLKQLIKKQGTLNEEKSLEILKGLLKGYSLLARRKIVHRDLKPANIMLHNMTPKIIDFGYCQIDGYQKPSLQYNVGSPSYMAPESFQHNVYNEKTQIWAIGIILYECLMGKTFDDGKHMSEVYRALKKFGIPFGRQISDKSRKIISWCLEFMPQKRPTALELINFLIEKKPDQPQFFILDKNRNKSNSLYNTTTAFDLNHMLINRKVPPVEKRIFGAFQPEKKILDVQGQTLRRKNSIKDNPKVIFEEIERIKSRSKSKSKEKFGAVVQKTTHRKVESMGLQTRERLNSNYNVKTQYGLNQDTVFKTDKYFTGQNVQNQIPIPQITKIKSALISPREMQRNSIKTIVQTNFTDKNPESAKQRIFSKTSNHPQIHCGQNYFDINPVINYRYSAHPQEKGTNDRKMLTPKQNNIPSVYIQHETHAFTSRQSFQYCNPKPNVIKHSTQFLQTYQHGSIHYVNRERPSSIYQLNKFSEDKEKPISIFRNGIEMAQKTYR